MTIPMDSRGNLCIYFPNNTYRVRRISADDILTGQLSEEAIKDKIVLVGLTASGLSQVYQIRTGLVISAVEVHAQAVENIISKIHIQRYPIVILSEIAIALLLTALFCICISWFGFMINALLGAIGILGIWQGSVQLFQVTGILVSPLLPAASLLITGIALTIFKYWQQQILAKNKADNALFLLKSSEIQLDSIIKTIPDIVFRLDSSGRIVFISPAILKYEKRPEEVIGKHILELVHPKDRDIANYRINERRTGTRATYDKELALLLNRKTPHDNEKYCHFSISAEGIYSNEKPGTNSFMGTQGIARDINKRKQLEYQLEQSKKMEAIGTLAAGVAHDLNNILGGLVGYPELLMMDLPKDSPMRNRLEMIQKSGQKAAAIVQDMLSLASYRNFKSQHNYFRIFIIPRVL
jgi:PAS domain S-box-containing protein